MDGPRSPYSPFQLIQVLGYEHGAAGGIYEATVKANPIDPDSTLLGLFAVNLGKPGEVNGDGTAFVALSISCNGVVWSPFIIISTTQAYHGRTYDLPVDGFVLRNSSIYFYIHTHVPGMSRQWNPKSRLTRYKFKLEALNRLTRAAHLSLPGCV
mmetsp:Transcript_27148/g.62273  ORF Transcript_27148/g.62273 Transcript_27148/m.62273 type:complete len:154 (-) Transcript_27148:445-906(-)